MEIDREIKNSQGFSLMELMIAIAIFSIIVALIVTSKVGQQDQSITQVQAVEMQQSVRSVMFQMKRELRRAGFNPFPTNYNSGILSATATSISFTAVASDNGEDDDNDGTTDEDGELETITFALADSDGDGDFDITASYDGGGAQVIAENVQNLNFTYFDSAGNITAVLNNIRSVQINVTTTTDVDELVRDTDNSTRRLTTTVYMRNMGL